MFEFRYKSWKSKFSSILFESAIWWLDTLKNGFKQKKKNPGLKFSPGIFELDELELGLAPRDVQTLAMGSAIQRIKG